MLWSGQHEDTDLSCIRNYPSLPHLPYSTCSSRFPGVHMVFNTACCYDVHFVLSGQPSSFIRSKQINLQEEDSPHHSSNHQPPMVPTFVYRNQDSPLLVVCHVAWWQRASVTRQCAVGHSHLLDWAYLKAPDLSSPFIHPRLCLRAKPRQTSLTEQLPLLLLLGVWMLMVCLGTLTSQCVVCLVVWCRRQAHPLHSLLLWCPAQLNPGQC